MTPCVGGSAWAVCAARKGDQPTIEGLLCRTHSVQINAAVTMLNPICKPFQAIAQHRIELP